MRLLRRRRSQIIALPLFILAATLNLAGQSPGLIQAQEKDPKAATVGDDDFRKLFNGKDLAGWDVIYTLRLPQRPLAMAKGWEVRDGNLVCATGDFLWLRTRDQFQDFVLKLEFRVPRDGANSGIYLRNPGKRAGLDGFHVNIVANDERFRPEMRSGSIYGAIAPAQLAKRPAGEWNDLEIYCTGTEVRVTLNGKITVQADISEYRALMDRPRSGYIGLGNFQGEAKGMAFRNIRIKELDLRPKPSTAP